MCVTFVTSFTPARRTTSPSIIQHKLWPVPLSSRTKLWFWRAYGGFQALRWRRVGRRALWYCRSVSRWEPNNGPSSLGERDPKTRRVHLQKPSVLTSEPVRKCERYDPTITFFAECSVQLSNVWSVFLSCYLLTCDDGSRASWDGCLWSLVSLCCETPNEGDESECWADVAPGAGRINRGRRFGLFLSLKLSLHKTNKQNVTKKHLGFVQIAFFFSSTRVCSRAELLRQRALWLKTCPFFVTLPKFKIQIYQN